MAPEQSLHLLSIKLVFLLPANICLFTMGLCQGGYLSGKTLSYGKERAVCILLECILVCGCFAGAARFLRDVETMIGPRSPAWHRFFTAFWKYLSPATLLVRTHTHAHTHAHIIHITRTPYSNCPTLLITAERVNSKHHTHTKKQISLSVKGHLPACRWMYGLHSKQVWTGWGSQVNKVEQIWGVHMCL